MKRKFGPVALATVAILLVPLIAMQFTDEIDWSLFDFIVMGALLFATGTVLQLILTRVRKPAHRLMLATGLAIIFLYVWAELAVGVFTSLGS